MSDAHPLRRWRSEHGLNQTAFADLVGTDQATISKIERGERVRFGLDLLLAIENATDGAITARSLAEAAQEAAS